MTLLRRSGGALTSWLLATSDNDRTWIDLIDQGLMEFWNFGNFGHRTSINRKCLWLRHIFPSVQRTAQGER
jgi:hypothetical protein